MACILDKDEPYWCEADWNCKDCPNWMERGGRMTREEAIEELYRIVENQYRSAEKDEEALSMAIKALEQEPTTKNDLAVDCISRKAVLDAIDSKAWEFCDYLISKGRNDEQKPVSHFADNLRECVSEELPPVTPQIKTGHWIKLPLIEVGQKYSHECSLCGRRILAIDIGLSEFPYCHCGAKMEVE